jgi:hypothetical protein
MNINQLTEYRYARGTKVHKNIHPSTMLSTTNPMCSLNFNQTWVTSFWGQQLSQLRHGRVLLEKQAVNDLAKIFPPHLTRLRIHQCLHQSLLLSHILSQANPLCTQNISSRPISILYNYGKVSQVVSLL